MNYGTFKILVEQYLHRNASVLGTLTDRFVELAGIRIGRDAELMELEATVDLEMVTNSLLLPANFMRARGIFVAQARGPFALEYRTPHQFAADQRIGGGLATVYTIKNSRLYTAPGIGAITIDYFTKPTVMVDDADTNSVLDNWLNLYLYGAVAEGFIYLQDAEAIAFYEGQYNNELQRCRDSAIEARFSGAPARVIGG